MRSGVVADNSGSDGNTREPLGEWLDYSGETTDELIAKAGRYRVDSIVVAFETAIDQKSTREPLSPEGNYVLAVEALEREVNNGGFDQFFVNTPEHAGVIVEALKAIQCPRTAEITHRAVEALGIKGPITRAAIEKVIYEDNPERGKVLSACDGEFYEYPEIISYRLFEWIKLHRDKIVIGNR